MASTVKYTSTASVKGGLPRAYSTTDLPDSVDTTYISLATHITRASRMVDAALTKFWVRFNAIDHGTYPTPDPIEEAALNLALYRCYRQLNAGDRNTRYGDIATERLEQANIILGSLMQEGDANPNNPLSRLIDVETVTSEALTFGVGGEYDIDTSEAFINVHSNLTSGDIPWLIAESVKVTTTGLTQYNYGRDFRVAFDPNHRKWKLVDWKQSLSDTNTISYQWSYRRYDELQVTQGAVISAGGW